ncbi:chaplin [Streptomyces sp. NPDC012765]|uniref:chaplin n=1 Tax=Streptomyces sp. NPDC012765 TaxID=3155249 RepID=UPI0033FAF753
MRQVLSRQVLGKGMLTAAAASSLLSIATGAAYAHPGATAEASHSPGVLAGNSVSVPITFAPNVCGNSVDGGAALNPSMGNTCVTSTGSHADEGYDYSRHLSPEHAEAIERYLDERGGGRHAVPEQRHENGYEQPRHERPRSEGPRHAKPRHEEPRHEGGYGGQGGEQPKDEECDDHPGSAPPIPPTHHAPPAPEHPHPMPEPVEEHPVPLPTPEPVQEAPAPLPEVPPAPPAPPAPQPPAEEAPAPEPLPAPEAPHTLPAPAPGPPPVVEEGPAPGPPRGSLPVEHPAPAPAPAPGVVPPADQPPATPGGDTPVGLPPAPAPLPAPAPAPAPAPEQPAAPAPAHVTGPMLAETGAGQPAAAAALASALILGGAILYRRSRIS